MRKYLLGVFILALGLRLCYLFFLSAGRPVHLDEWIYYNTVSHWLAGQDLKSVYHPPLYQLLMFLVFKVSSVSFIALQLIQVLMGALTAVLAALIGKEASNEKIGLIAGFVYAVSIRPVKMPVMLLSETLFTFLLILAVWIFIKAVKKITAAGRHRLTQINFILALSGGLFGLAALTRSPGLYLPFLFAFYLLVRFRPSVYTVLRSSVAILIFILAFALPLVPWVQRGYKITGHFVPGGTSYGVTFFWHNTDMMWVPGSDYISGIKLAEMKDYSGAKGRPLPDGAQHHLTRQMGEISKGHQAPVENARCMIDYALNHLASIDLLQLVGLEVLKLYRLVLPYHQYYNPFPDVTFLVVLPFFLFAVYKFAAKALRHKEKRHPGVFMTLWQDFSGIGIIFLLIIYLVLTTLVFGGMPRYRDPYDPYIIILAVIGAKEFIDNWRK